MKKWAKRLYISCSLGIIALLSFGILVLAVPDSITDLIGTATSTTISLTWTKSSSSDNTTIRYSTADYPATPASGTSAYSGSSSFTTLENLTVGTIYYFSAWGYDGADYSTTAANLVVTTFPSVSENTTAPYPQPTIPAGATADPDSSGWSISPIDDILAYFADPASAHSGLGMPTDNVIMFIAGVGVTFVSLGSYIKWRSFWTSWTIAMILSSFACSIEVMQWIVVGFLLLAGAGVWAVEKSTQ
jgi:hypothetical protein